MVPSGAPVRLGRRVGARDVGSDDVVRHTRAGAPGEAIGRMYDGVPSLHQYRNVVACRVQPPEVPVVTIVAAWNVNRLGGGGCVRVWLG